MRDIVVENVFTVFNVTLFATLAATLAVGLSTPATRRVVLGDTLFAGSVGRTDLPGGDHQAMLRSLATKVLTLPDDIVVLPGHGEQTSIGRERATNPFLLDLLSPEQNSD